MQTKGGSFTGDDKDFLKVRLGSNQVIPAFEEALRGMKVGGIRRIIVPEVPVRYLSQVTCLVLCVLHELCNTVAAADRQSCNGLCYRKSAIQTIRLTQWGRSRPISRCVTASWLLPANFNMRFDTVIPASQSQQFNCRPAGSPRPRFCAEEPGVEYALTPAVLRYDQ